ncbi:hypothetical protein BVG79_01705 [Ketogulonicigenium robustum]|uniref:Uncharacterized protein n=1 Tax=Ketogulonicigenium robustum TaxID=92947 RepID=A0A1W6P0S1_9RHOB|nr:hypothetical protein BVG79_01705 [Ketogulonicigenium robustum]
MFQAPSISRVVGQEKPLFGATRGRAGGFLRLAASFSP